jgi:hypothetical protein
MSNAEVFGPNDPGPRDAKDAGYTDGNGGSGGGQNGGGAAAKPFPWERLAFTVIFAFVAWFAFWLALILALISGGLKLFNVSSQENFAGYARSLYEYLSSVLAYVSGTTETKPFPFG